MTGGNPLQQVGAVFLSAALMAAVSTISGCTTGEPKREPPAEPPMTQSRPLPATPSEPAPKQNQADDVQKTAPQLPRGSGQAVWAEGFTGQLVQGLDGELYTAYRAATIKQVQSVLRERGLYSGPVNGVLDPPTMESIYVFQGANYYLQRCGVPTPMTRKLLEQGSHTDAPS